MEKAEKIILTNMCMIENGDKVLVQNRVASDWSGITFPGGHVEKGESFTDAVIREVFEETGLTISHPQLCGLKSWPIKHNIRYIVFFYKTDSFTGTLHSSEEGEVFWVKKDELLTLNLASDMEDMYKVFCNEKLSEFYYHKENGKWIYDLK